MAPEWPWQKNRLGPPGNATNSWTVHNRSLFINFMPGINQRFQQDIDQKIAKATERWISWWGKLNAGPFNVDCLPGPDGGPQGMRDCGGIRGDPHPQCIPGLDVVGC